MTEDRREPGCGPVTAVPRRRRRNMVSRLARRRDTVMAPYTRARRHPHMAERRRAPIPGPVTAVATGRRLNVVVRLAGCRDAVMAPAAATWSHGSMVEAGRDPGCGAVTVATVSECGKMTGRFGWRTEPSSAGMARHALPRRPPEHTPDVARDAQRTRMPTRQ